MLNSKCLFLKGNIYFYIGREKTFENEIIYENIKIINVIFLRLYKSIFFKIFALKTIRY